ncbi:Exocyst complex component 7, partial [Toxocara canis]
MSSYLRRENSKNFLSTNTSRTLSALGLNLKNKADYYNDETLAAVFLLNNNNYIHNTLHNDGMFAVVCEHNSEVRSFYKSEINQLINNYLRRCVCIRRFLFP